MAPPLTLTFAVSQPRSLLTAQACAANASLASTRSRSATFHPAFLSAARDAGIGPVPMIAGSTHACAQDTMRAGDLPLARDVLGSVAHMIAVERIPEAVLDHGIDHVEVAHFHPAAQMGAVRRLAHRFLPPRDHDFGVAVENGLVTKGDRAQAGPTKLVDAPGRDLHRDTRSDRGLAGRILALAGRENLTQDNLGDLRPLDPGALERLLDSDFPQFVGGKRRERPVEGPDRRAGGSDDDNIVLHL